MAETLYTTGVVIPCGVADHEGDVLNKTDIKKIFTKYINRDTDTMHSRIKNTGVDVLANWITETDTTIAGKVAPAGSWLATLKITNDEIIKAINDGNIQGLSLGSVSDVALTQDYWFINKSINYKDLDDMEEVIPLFISFVDKPSNQYGLEVMDYNVYINKRVDDMAEETTKTVEEEKYSISTIQKFRDMFAVNKAEDDEEKIDEEEIEKAEEDETTTDTTDDITNRELLEQIGDKVEEAIINAFKQLQEARNEETEEVVVEKAEEDEKEKDDDDAPADEPATEEEDEDEDKKIDKSEKTSEPVNIDKRATVKTEQMEQPNTSTNFYKKSGRDAFGCRIRK